MQAFTNKIGLFALILFLLAAYITAAPRADHAIPLQEHQTQTYLTGSWLFPTAPTDSPTSFLTNTPSIKFSFALSPLQVTLQLFQRQNILFDAPIPKITNNEGEQYHTIELATEYLAKLDYSIPIQYLVTLHFNAPSKSAMEPGTVIKSCLDIVSKPPTNDETFQIYHNFCVDIMVTRSAVYYTPNDDNQLHFRSYCGGQAPYDPLSNVETAHMGFDYDLNQSLPITSIISAQDIKTTPCERPERFHITATRVQMTREDKEIEGETAALKPYSVATITFHIFGNANIMTSAGAFNPPIMQCRVNTHYIKFFRHDFHPEDGDFPGNRDHFPAGHAIYISYDVDEIVDSSSLEIECEKVGLHYNIYEAEKKSNAPANDDEYFTEDRIPVKNIKYDTGIHVSIAYEKDFEAITDVTQYTSRPSFSIFFDSPDLPNPFDMDIHATTALIAAQTDQTTENAAIQLFGRFYLTGKPDPFDYIEICPMNIKMTGPMHVLITQRSWNVTNTNPLPLFQDTVKPVPASVSLDNDPVTEPGCYKVNIWSQHAWRVNVTATPQVFAFYITTQASEYTPGSSLISKFVAHYPLSPTPALTPTGLSSTVPRTIVAATPLPSYSTRLSESIAFTKPIYDSEIASEHSPYSAKFTQMTFTGLSQDYNRISFSVSGYHSFDGDIQCMFKYKSVDGDAVQDEISPRIDKTVQDAILITFDLESAISAKDTPVLVLDCKGLFVVSKSYHAFTEKSILQVSARDVANNWYFITEDNFLIDKSETAPIPYIPSDPEKDDDGDDDKDQDAKKTPWKTVLLVCGAVLIGVAIFGLIGWFIARRNKKSEDTNGGSDILINSDGYEEESYRMLT